MVINAIYGSGMQLNQRMLELVNDYSKTERIMVFDCENIFDNNELIMIEPYDINKRLRNIFLMKLDSSEKLIEFMEDLHVYHTLNIKKIIFTSFSFLTVEKETYKEKYRYFMHSFLSQLRTFSSMYGYEFIVGIPNYLGLGEFADYIDDVNYCVYNDVIV